jgi:hypothetical protein
MKHYIYLNNIYNFISYTKETQRDSITKIERPNLLNLKIILDDVNMYISDFNYISVSFSTPVPSS